jgi:hypothetical protein
MSSDNFYNGRVVELDNVSYPPMNMSNNNLKTENIGYADKAIINIGESTDISKLFFSETNIDNIQAMIRYNVYKMSNEMISTQSATELKIVMRSYFLQYAKNSPSHLKEQLNDLNNMVLNYCVPKIYDEILQHKDYIKDVQSLPVPMDLPICMSSAGTKSLKSVTNTF